MRLLLLATCLALSAPRLAAAETRTLASGGRERTFHLHLPPGLDRTRPAPLVFVFHGAGGNGTSDLDAYRWLADRDGFLLVGPDGLNQRWNAGNRDEILATDQADDVAFVRDMVRAIGREWKVDAARVFAVGFSNGAALCHRLAAEAPDLIAAVAGAGATMPKATQSLLKPGSAISVQIMVGTEDGMFGRKGDLRGGTFLTADESAGVWAKHNGCAEATAQATPVPFTRWPANAPATAEVELWIVEGAGHTPSLGGTAWSTAEEQWKFLSRHSRPSGAPFTVYRSWPFPGDEARKRQAETAAALGLPVETTIALEGGVAVAFRLVPAGRFTIGSLESEAGDSPVPNGHPETRQETQ